jgi:large conductance mechanosensitive channel
MQNYLNEFKAFAIRGAFGAIVTSLVNDVIMPPIGVLLGGTDFSDLAIKLNDEASINYGAFLNTVINFLIIAVALFVVIKWINVLQAKPEEAPLAPTTKECPHCYTQIPIKATRCPNCTSQLES